MATYLRGVLYFLTNKIRPMKHRIIWYIKETAEWIVILLLSGIVIYSLIELI